MGKREVVCQIKKKTMKLGKEYGTSQKDVRRKD
jgi:hypothetical protein